MTYKIANIFSRTYDTTLNKYVVKVLLSRQGRCKEKKLFYAFKEDAEQVKIGDCIEMYDERKRKK